LYPFFDKAFSRRFDAIINFNRYSQEDLIEVAEYYFSSFIKNFRGISKDTRLFKKILRSAEKLPYPGELKNIIKSSLAFSDTDFEFDYLRRLYNNIIGNLEQTEIHQLHLNGFTVREIEKLKGESKSSIARKLSKEGD
jgi:SpoVK/Ycf46/Vps4 family AAA+-type ATPase